jgi:hypothetical protein
MEVQETTYIPEFTYFKKYLFLLYFKIINNRIDFLIIV